MATADFKLKGVKKFMKELDREIKELKGRTLEGLIHAVIELQREAEPGTPIDVGNLRSSWFSVTYKGEKIGIAKFEGEDAGKLASHHNEIVQKAVQAAKGMGKDAQPIVLFGYTANYAVFVHENVDASFKRPGAKARWLYAAMQSARSKMLAKIHEHARF